MTGLRKEWSCEHCGMATTSPKYDCEHCGSLVCDRCADELDEGDPLSCPVKAEAADG